jgi:hypothetical protein
MADMFQPHGLPAAQLPTAPPAQFAPPAVVALNKSAIIIGQFDKFTPILISTSASALIISSYL